MVKKDNQTLPKTGVNVGVIVGGLTSLVSGLGLARKKKDKK
ncbi:MAG: LPXTG cell wall anchor domain-containing protein [Aerococcus suis]|nr:LPXTG cell wall anchor domain-containing protein [Aerococcus suis]